MKKNAITVTCYTCAASAFGVFARWLQDQISYNEELGLIMPGFLGYVVAFVTLAAAFVFYKRIGALKKMGLRFPTEQRDAFYGKGTLYSTVAWSIGSIMMLGGLITLLTVSGVPDMGLYSVVAILAVVSGIAFPMVCASGRANYSPALVCFLLTLPIVLMMFWIIASYKANATSPSVWSYAIEILALCSALITFYYIAGFPYGRPQPERSMFMSMLSAFLCISTLADNRIMGLQLVILALAMMFVMYNHTFVLNMKESAEAGCEPAAAEELDILTQAEIVAPEKAPEPAEETESPADDEDSDVKQWKPAKKQ